MSADPIRGIGPVSVRYAAQIREMLHAQAMQRLAAEREAARAAAEAERADRVEAPDRTKEAAEPLSARIETAPSVPPSREAAAPPAEPKAEPAPAEAGHLVDIQA